LIVRLNNFQNRRRSATVSRQVATGITLTDEQMSKLFTDFGFTFRSILTVPHSEQEAL